jgi:hypothetical protein
MHLRVYLASLLLILGSLSWQRAAGADPPIPLEAYWQKLEATQTLAEGLTDAPPEDAGPALRAEADEWERLTLLTLPDGSTLPIHHSWLTMALRADPPAPDRVAARITAHLAARDTWEQRAASPQDLAVLRDILTRPEFQWETPQPNWLEKLLQQLQEWFWEWLNRLFGGRQIVIANSPLIYVIAGTIVVVLALVIGFFLRGLLANLVSETAAPADPRAADEDLSAEAALQKAQALSGAGDYRTAVRYLYLSALLLLEERGLLRYNRTLTNREYLRSVSHLPELSAILRDVVEVFDQVWYGYHPLDEGAYMRYAARVADLQKQK